MKALSGVKVLDLTRALAGPYCTLMLGDYGADVIKIEIPGRGDDTRQWGPPFVNGESAYFLSINRNKRSLTLNLKDPAGRGIFMKLAKDADVVVENFTPGVAQRLGIDYESVKGVNPNIVYASISGFGQTGPYRRKPAYDQMMQGLGGIMSLTGEPEGEPQKMGIALTDIGAGMLAAYAITVALFHRERTGEGQYIDVSMLDLQVSWLTYQAGTYFATGSPPARVGAAHPNLAPYQAFMCADGKFVNVAVGNERFWGRFCEAMGRTDLVDHPQFALNRDQGEQSEGADRPAAGGISECRRSRMGANSGKSRSPVRAHQRPYGRFWRPAGARARHASDDPTPLRRRDTADGDTDKIFRHARGDRCAAACVGRAFRGDFG